MNDNGARGYKVVACSASSGEETVGVKEGKGRGRKKSSSQTAPSLSIVERTRLVADLLGSLARDRLLVLSSEKGLGSMFSLPSSLVRSLRLGMRLLAFALPGFLLIRLAVNCELE